MATVDNRIQVNSSYKVVYSETGLTKAILNVWIYTGTQGGAVAAGTDASDSSSNDRPADPTRVLESQAIAKTSSDTDLFVSLNISNLIKEYISQNYDGVDESSKDSAVVFADYQLISYVGSTATYNEMVQCVAYDGVTYFWEGNNAQIIVNGLITADTMCIMDGDSPIIAVDTNKTELVQFLTGSNTLGPSYAVSPSTDSEDQIKYYTGNADDGSIIVSNSGGYHSNTITIKKLTQCDYPVYEVTFVNRFGALEHLPFYGNSTISISNKSKTFNRNISDYTDGGSYNTYDAPMYKDKISSKQGFTLNSGFYPEACNSSFEELMEAKDVWIDYDGYILPIIIKDSTFNVKTNLNDKAINYTVMAEFAFNRINDI